MLVALLTVLFNSCTPLNKEDYLERYQRFMDDVSKDYRFFTSEQWQKANEQFELFSNEWYNKYRNQLTLEEKMRLAGYKVKYNGLRAASEIGKLYDEHLKGDVEELRARVRYYVDNRMDDDINKLLEEARKAGKIIYEEVKKIVDEVKCESRK